ncbi:MAG: LamG-like jellyroll fold domain-containing protein [Elusimicrobiota bacterium]|nr:LamG-like jellyroll fold domain-containing protein [Elusimicrobiota bacterium]
MINKIKAYFIVAVMAFSLWADVSAYTFSGYCYDEAQNPLSGVDVYLYWEGTTYGSAFSDANGYFFIDWEWTEGNCDLYAVSGSTQLNIGDGNTTCYSYRPLNSDHHEQHFYAGTAPEPGLVGRWRFENNMVDSSGHGNTGVLCGGASFDTPYKEGSYSLYFDGIDGCVEIADIVDSSLDLNGPFSIELWAVIGPYSWTMNLVNKMDSAFGIQLETPGVVRFYTADQSMDSPENVVPTDNSWVHIAAVYDGTRRIIYVNGSAVATENFTTNPVVNDFNLLIGRHSDAFTGQYFNGYMDDVKIYNYARTASDIASDAGISFSGEGGSFEIRRNVFNPLTDACEIRTALAAGSSAEVKIYDAAGRVVKSFDTSSAVFNWHGRDNDGGIVANGVYYVYISGGGIKDAKPVAVFKE